METACLLFGAMAWYVMISCSVPLGLKHHTETGSGSGSGFPGGAAFTQNWAEVYRTTAFQHELERFSNVARMM